MNCVQDALTVKGWRLVSLPREPEAISPRS
jgi:hypothetical protein